MPASPQDFLRLQPYPNIVSYIYITNCFQYCGSLESDWSEDGEYIFYRGRSENKYYRFIYKICVVLPFLTIQKKIENILDTGKMIGDMMCRLIT